MSELSQGVKVRDTPGRVDAAVVSPCGCLAALLTAWQKQRNQTDVHDKENAFCMKQTDDAFIRDAKVPGCCCQTSTGSHVDLPQQ